jgi:hypothetical protein
MTKSARDELAKYGISIGFPDNGTVELTSQRGITCGYSARVYSAVIGFGADGRIMIRLAGKGVAQLRINGEQFEYRAGDASLRMAVPKPAAHLIKQGGNSCRP